MHFFKHEREPGGCMAASLRLARVLRVESRATFMLGKCPTLELVCEGRSKETADSMATREPRAGRNENGLNMA